MKNWKLGLLGLVVLIITIGGYCYVCKKNNTNFLDSFTAGTISGEYDNTLYQYGREYLESINNRNRVSISRVERSREQLGEIRAESDRIAEDNREAGRINTETAEYYSGIRNGTERIARGIELIQSGIEQLQNIVRHSRGTEPAAAENNSSHENHPGDPNNSDNM